MKVGDRVRYLYASQTNTVYVISDVFSFIGGEVVVRLKGYESAGWYNTRHFKPVSASPSLNLKDWL